MIKTIFISIPYTNKDKRVTNHNIRIAQKYFLKLIEQGHTPICPPIIAQSLTGLKKPSPESWRKYHEACIELSDEVHVLQFDGYEKSIRVMRDRKCAGLQVVLINPDTI